MLVFLLGVLSRLGGKSLNPQSGQNLLGDFGGGGLMCAFGILAALLERNVSAKGQVLDAKYAQHWPCIKCHISITS